MNATKTSNRDLCFISIFTAIIAISSQLIIPMPSGMPMTLQTLIIPLAGMILGIKNGTLSTCLYILIGAIGLPVFAGFEGGMGIVFGHKGGFILSFPILAITAGIGVKKNNKLWLVLWLVIGSIINYICGMFVFHIVTSNSLLLSFTCVVLPFIPTAILKIVIAVMLGNVIKKALLKSGLLS